jgi:hypothetical protein
MVRHTEIPMKKKAVLYWEESEKKIGKEKDPSKNPSSCRFKSVYAGEHINPLSPEFFSMIDF